MFQNNSANSLFRYPDIPGVTIFAGTDEAGRGPLVGNVVAGAVILDPARPIPGLRDSKKLSEKKREELFLEITEKALAFGIGECTPGEIDSLNILWASMLAMERAIRALKVEPHYVLVDGNRIPRNLGIPAGAVVKGDALVPEISAASILAKVTRDRELRELDVRYPQYGFARHKGYPTAEHLARIRELGVLSCYRKSYRPVREILLETDGRFADDVLLCGKNTELF
ncbi:ribonuclease HII [Succinimonas amylolytica]|uniref:ribonuclease HII n=1 Tax=Succinimonas amylolytica TaxID=83769 RepID=UPI0023A84F80